MAASIKDNFHIGAQCIICKDADLRGDITIGQGCVLHPRCTVLAVSAPIIIGDECIIEENAIILNATKEPMIIGSYNHFQVGCRIEAQKIGSWNTFEVKCRVPSSISIQDYCIVGAGTNVKTLPVFELDEDQHGQEQEQEQEQRQDSKHKEHEPSSEMSIDNNESPTPTPPSSTSTGKDNQLVPSYTVFYGPDSLRRNWSGQGKRQQQAMLFKHLEYLRDIIPEYSKLKMITNTPRVPSTTNT